jgi:hypothetical protein
MATSFNAFSSLTNGAKAIQAWADEPHSLVAALI